MDKQNYSLYVSTRADYDPAKLLIVCPPSGQAGSREQAEAFGVSSGWQTLAEAEGAVLLIPVVPEGWAAESTDLPARLYDTLRNSFSSRNGRSLLGRGGKLWCWETMVYLIGYEDGAVFAGNCVVAHPNRFAAVVLAGGAPSDYSPADLPSSHWMVKQVSPDYQKTNRQIPSCVWILGAPEEAARKAVEYFTEVDGAQPCGEVCPGGLSARCWRDPEHPARQILVSGDAFREDALLAFHLYSGLLEHVIRWKDGPDGTLRFHPTRQEYYAGGEYAVDAVSVNALDYPYGIRLPQGMTREEAAGLPLVFSVHGRGEPAWMFCSKNGWDRLQDETRAFVLAVPDSPGNIWQLQRDGEAFCAMVEKICTDYALDRSRVYLTGFSNGAAITREVGTAYPQLFAGLSPWNGPVHVPGGLISHQAIEPELLEGGWEMPYWVCAGDNDPVTTLESMEEQLTPLLKANHCTSASSEAEDGGYRPDEVRTGAFYSGQKGYAEGDRLYTRVYSGPDGEARVCYTLMKNMPHGAIPDQSRAAWEFLRHFSRPEGSRTVVYQK